MLSLILITISAFTFISLCVHWILRMESHQRLRLRNLCWVKSGRRFQEKLSSQGSIKKYSELWSMIACMLPWVIVQMQNLLSLCKSGEYKAVKHILERGGVDVNMKDSSYKVPTVHSYWWYMTLFHALGIPRTGHPSCMRVSMDTLKLCSCYSNTVQTLTQKP